MKKYILAFLFLCYLLPSQAQIFYKERIYGKEERRETNDFKDYDYYASKDHSSSDDTFDSTWINEPIYISNEKNDDRIYKREDAQSSISLSATKIFMKQRGQLGVVKAIESYQKKQKLSPKLRKISTYMIFVPAIMLFVIPSVPSTRSYLFATLGAGIGMNIVGRKLKHPSKNKIYQEIEAYNAGLKKNENSSFDKNFFPNFRPSKIILKPVRMNLLNPTPVPTLGMTWNF